VNPETLRKKAERLLGTNVPPSATHQEDLESPENQSPEPEIKAPRKHRATGSWKGRQDLTWVTY